MSGDEDKIIGMLRKFGRAKSSNADRTGCPSEETLSLFLGGALAGDARSDIESHLEVCSFCSETLVAAYKAAEPGETARVPQELMERAMAFVPAKEAFFELAVRLLRGSIELIGTTGRVVPLLSPALRGEPKPVESSALQVEQKVGRFKIAVEIDVGDLDACQVITNVTEESGAPAEGVRLTLNSQDREQASFLTRAGVVVFDRISPGEYSIAVSESDNLVGKIRLNLMLER